MDYTVQLKELPQQLALRTSRTVTLDTIGAEIGTAFEAVMTQAAASGASYAGMPFVVYPEECAGEFPMVLCMPVVPGCPEPAAESGVELVEIAGGPAACVIHKGPYDKLGDAYGVLQTWLKANDKAPAGPPREIYMNAPDEVGGPDELLTEVAWPVA